MWQKNYQYDSVEDAIRGLRAVAAEIGSREYFDGLFVIFAGGICQKEVKKLTDAMDEVFPEIKRAGMSEFYNGGDTGEKRIKLNLTLSDTSRFSVFQFPCEPGGEREAAWQLRQRMEEISDIKCIGLFPSGMALNITEFLESATEGREEVPVFGAMAAVIPQLPGEEAEDMERYCIGESLTHSGITAVVFAGSELQVSMDYILGWQPLGKEMTVTLGEPGELGEGCIRLIDGKPAVDIYKKYFGVEWDENFVWNICEFPLMIRRNDTDICMVPITKGEEGELYICGPIKEGETLRFSYGTWEEIVGASRTGSLKMAEFEPDSVFLSLCGNRINYLREDAHLEWDFFRAKFPELVYCHGQYEIAWQHRKGGVLNSSFIAVGMKEGEGQNEVEM
ncbi:MAG: hypothetical protein IJ733_11260, partial [Lachnospiraceae bacterium]|nr:hypothetical protein [Lachnospiraceae bacterium]